MSSRTKNSVYNVSAAMSNKIITIITAFLNRTIIIYLLGDVFLGLNSLFTTILTVLSLSELGFTSAITFHLYKPIKDENISKLKEISALYKKSYKIIGIIMFGAGILLMPFLNKLVNFDVRYDVNIYIVYLLTLTRSVVSYWFYGFSQSIIEANQKQHIISTYSSISNILSTILVFFGLFIFKNYYLYLSILILVEIIKNLFLYHYSTKNYEYLKDLKHIPISKDLKKSVFKDVYSVFIFKISTTISQSIDNIIISSMIGTIFVGYYGNYTLIATYAISMVTMIINSLGASVGNLNATSNKKNTKSVFLQIDLLNFIMLSITVVCLNQLLTPFMSFWLKDSKYLLSNVCVYLICANNYLNSSHNAIYIFRNALGLFTYGKYNFLLCGICNLILSIILGNMYGIVGVLLATFLSYLFISTFSFPYHLYNKGFHESSFPYMIEMIFRMILVLFMCFSSKVICSFIPGDSLLSLICQGIICTFIVITIVYLAYFKTRKFKCLIARFKPFLPLKIKQ